MLITLALAVIIAVIAFVFTKTYASSLSSITGGIVVGNVVAQIVGFFAMGYPITIGSSEIFGLIMLSILACGVGIQLFSSVREKFVSTSVRRRSLSSEEAQESEFDGKFFDEYFTNNNEEK